MNEIRRLGPKAGELRGDVSFGDVFRELDVQLRDVRYRHVEFLQSHA